MLGSEEAVGVVSGALVVTVDLPRVLIQFVSSPLQEDKRLLRLSH